MVLRLDLGGPVLELVKVGDHDYAAELDGKRLPIRTRSTTHEVTSAGAGRDWVGEWEDVPSLRLSEELAGITPTRTGDVFRFDYASDGHFRQHVSGYLTIELRDGVVVIDAERWEQDESYY